MNYIRKVVLFESIKIHVGLEPGEHSFVLSIRVDGKPPFTQEKKIQVTGERVPIINTKPKLIDVNWDINKEYQYDYSAKIGVRYADHTFDHEIDRDENGSQTKDFRWRLHGFENIVSMHYVVSELTIPISVESLYQVRVKA